MFEWTWRIDPTPHEYIVVVCYAQSSRNNVVGELPVTREISDGVWCDSPVSRTTIYFLSLLGWNVADIGYGLRVRVQASLPNPCRLPGELRVSINMSKPPTAKLPGKHYSIRRLWDRKMITLILVKIHLPKCASSKSNNPAAMISLNVDHQDVLRANLSCIYKNGENKRQQVKLVRRKES